MTDDYRGYTHPRPSRNKVAQIDVHELQKREILKHGNNSSVDGGANFRFSTVGRQPNLISTVREPCAPEVQGIIPPLQKPFPPYIQTPVGLPQNYYPGRHEIGIEDYYIDFDSASKEETSDMSVGELHFSLPKANKDQPIENIIEMEIERPFTVPDVIPPANVPSQFFFDDITLFLRDIQPESVTAPNNIKWHWKFRATPETNPPSNQELRQILDTHRVKYMFRRPIRNLENARFIFGRPAVQDRLSLPQDTFVATSVSNNPGQFQTSIPHGLTIGLTYSIYISGFNSSNSTANVQVNNTQGHLMIVIDATTLQFLAAIDLTGLGGFQAKLLVGYRRIMFTIRFRTLTDHPTNYIAP